MKTVTLVAFADERPAGLRPHPDLLQPGPGLVLRDADGNLSGDNPAHGSCCWTGWRPTSPPSPAYGDRMWAKDVVNEASASQADGLAQRWYNIIGPDYLDHAFTSPSSTSAGCEALPERLQHRVPGQAGGHVRWSRDAGPRRPDRRGRPPLHLSLSAGLRSRRHHRAVPGLPVEQAVTELDVAIAEHWRVAAGAAGAPGQQGYYFRDLFEVLRSHSTCSHGHVVGSARRAGWRGGTTVRTSRR